MAWVLHQVPHADMQIGCSGFGYFASGLVVTVLGLVSGCNSRGELGAEDGSDNLGGRCGNGRCDGKETCGSCPSDCGMCDGSSGSDAGHRDNESGLSSDAGSLSDSGLPMIDATTTAGTHYYVATDGSDSTGDGSQSRPWAT